MMDEEEFERWLRQAEHTLASARGNIEDGDFDWACFKAHQAAEYALKGLLRAARRLDRHYLAPRYPNQWAEGAPVDYYDEEEAEEALREAEAIVGAVRRWRERLRSA